MGLSAFNRYRREQALKQETVPEMEIVETIDYEELTRAELKEILDKKGIEYNDRDNKSTLIELLKQVSLHDR